MHWISGTQKIPLLLLGLCMQNYKYRVTMVMENLEKSGYFTVKWSGKVIKSWNYLYICFSGFALSARKPNP